MKRSDLWRPLPWAVVALALYWLAMFVGTHVPRLPRFGPPVMTDKVAHFAGYLGLAFLVSAVTLRRTRWSAGAALLIFAGVILYGVVDELLQIPIPGRTAEIWDWVADCLGALTGIVLFRIAQKVYAARALGRRSAREVAFEQG